MRVFINPGHAPDGNPDPGAVNPVTGARESDYAKTAGDILVKYLKSAGCEVAHLQSDDLWEICDASNKFNADVFVSLHCNAFNMRARGTETLYKSSAGRKLAECIQSQIVDSIDVIDRGVKKRDDLYVLNRTQAVAVLVEMAFIDNMEDLQILNNDLDTIVRAIARGVTDYANLYM